jgi:hypothetical protein
MMPGLSVRLAGLGRRVSWADFRDYTGVFVDPVTDSLDGEEGSSWDLPDLHFSWEQYVAEIHRTSRDRSWETDRRRLARLLYERLEPLKPVLPPGLSLAWASATRTRRPKTWRGSCSPLPRITG